MEFKGTKGPWQFDIDEYYNHAYVYVQGKGNVFELNYTDENMTETPYNMLLASKAPEMLQMLIDLRECKETWSGLFQSDKDRIEELINSATQIK